MKNWLKIDEKLIKNWLKQCQSHVTNDEKIDCNQCLHAIVASNDMKPCHQDWFVTFSCSNFVAPIVTFSVFFWFGVFLSCGCHETVSQNLSRHENCVKLCQVVSRCAICVTWCVRTRKSVRIGPNCSTELSDCSSAVHKGKSSNFGHFLPLIAGAAPRPFWTGFCTKITRFRQIWPIQEANATPATTNPV